MVWKLWFLAFITVEQVQLPLWEQLMSFSHHSLCCQTFLYLHSTIWTSTLHIQYTELKWPLYCKSAVIFINVLHIGPLNHPSLPQWVTLTCKYVNTQTHTHFRTNLETHKTGHCLSRPISHHFNPEHNKPFQLINKATYNNQGPLNKSSVTYVN